MTDSRRDNLRPTIALYAAATLLCAVFGVVYEHFSHQVYSAFMIFAFLIPLLGGVVPYAAAGFVYRQYLPPQAARTLYNSGIAALTVGCVFAGMLEIYGTTNRLLYVYPTAGAVLILAAAVVWAIAAGRRSARDRRSF